jgi:hypothetical protein
MERGRVVDDGVDVGVGFVLDDDALGECEDGWRMFCDW